MCGNVLAILVVDKVGRKVLLFASSLGMAVALFSLGTFFYLEEHQEIECPDFDTECVPQYGKFSSDLVDDLGWLPLASLILYSIAFAIGNYSLTLSNTTCNSIILLIFKVWVRCLGP